MDKLTISEDKAYEIIKSFLYSIDYGTDISIERDNTDAISYTVKSNFYSDEGKSIRLLCLNEEEFINLLKKSLYDKGYDSVKFSHLNRKKDHINYQFNIRVITYSKKLIKR